MGRRTIALSSLQFAPSSEPQCQSSQRRRAGSRRRHLRDSARAVVAMRLRVARGYPQSVNLRRDAEQAGREVTSFLWAEMRMARKACAGGAAGVTAGCQGTITLPNTAHEIDIATKPALIYGWRIAWSPISQCARNEVQREALLVHDLHHEHPHPPRQVEAHRRQSRHQ